MAGSMGSIASATTNAALMKLVDLAARWRIAGVVDVDLSEGLLNIAALDLASFERLRGQLTDSGPTRQSFVG